MNYLLLLFMIVKLINTKKLFVPLNSYRIGRNKTKARQHFKKAEQLYKNRMSNQLDDVFVEYRKKLQNQTILRDFRQQVFKKQRTNEVLQKLDNQYDEHQNKIDKILNDTKSKQKTTRFSKKLMNKLLNKGTIIKDKDLFKDDRDYTSYSTNYPTYSDRSLYSMEFLDENTSIQKQFKFLDSLPEDYVQKKQLKRRFRENDPYLYDTLSIAQLGKNQQISQTNFQRYKKYVQMKAQQEKIDASHNIIDNEQTRGNFQSFTHMMSSDNPNRGYGFSYTLSPQAFDKIYQLYLQGWSIRQISKRFGILPRRAKLCIWCRGQYYNQILPKIGIKQFIFDKIRQVRFAQERGILDYGIDIQYMNQKKLLSEIKGWNDEMVDVQRKPQQYTLALQKLQSYKKFDRYEKVQVGTHGQQNKRYLLKEWHIFRGKGSDKYHIEYDNLRVLTKAKKKMLYEYY